MGYTALISEFNPFHNGHKFIVEEAKRQTGKEVVVLMSGNFVQRGEAAVLNKQKRAEIAVKNGAAAVYELPVYFAVANAETFSLGAVNILNKLNNIDCLFFGSECGDIDLLTTIAKIDLSESTEYKIELKKQISTGILYAKARENAVRVIYGDKLARECKKPNNILGVEYIKALIKTNSKIIPKTVKRRELQGNAASSSKIRDMLKTNDILSVKRFVPENCYNYLSSAIDYNAAEKKLFDLIKYQSSFKSANVIKNLPEVTEGLENRILDGVNTANCYQEFLNYVKSKRYTMAKVKRIAVNMVLNIDKNVSISALKDLSYVKVLAIDKTKKELLKNPNFSLITSSKLPDCEFSRIDLAADNVYSILSGEVIKTQLNHKMQIISAE